MDENYMEWLHDLTVWGYEDNTDIVTLSTADVEIIKRFYENGFTPLEALMAYKKYKNEQKSD